MILIVNFIIMNDFQYIFLNHWFAKTSYKNHNAHSKELINYIKNSLQTIVLYYLILNQFFYLLYY